MNSFELAKKGSLRVGDDVRCKSVSASAHGVFGEVGQIVSVDGVVSVDGDLFEVAVCGLRLWFYADDLEGLGDAESGTDSGAVGGAGGASGVHAGASASDGAGDVSGTCHECGRSYQRDS